MALSVRPFVPRLVDSFQSDVSRLLCAFASNAAARLQNGRRKRRRMPRFRRTRWTKPANREKTPVLPSTRSIEFCREPWIEILHKDIDQERDEGIDARVADAMAPSPTSQVRFKLPSKSIRKLSFWLRWFFAWHVAFLKECGCFGHCPYGNACIRPLDATLLLKLVSFSWIHLSPFGHGIESGRMSSKLSQPWKTTSHGTLNMHRFHCSRPPSHCTGITSFQCAIWLLLIHPLSLNGCKPC